MKHKSPETRLEKPKRQLHHILNDVHFYMNDDSENL